MSNEIFEINRCASHGIYSIKIFNSRWKIQNYYKILPNSLSYKFTRRLFTFMAENRTLIKFLWHEYRSSQQGTS